MRYFLHNPYRCEVGDRVTVEQFITGPDAEVTGKLKDFRLGWLTVLTDEGREVHIDIPTDRLHEIAIRPEGK